MDTAARIGPNAITRVAEALGPAMAVPIFSAAGLEQRLREPPGTMVPECEVTALHRALRDLLGDSEADHVAREAGRLTARYLLGYRIPRLLQRLLRLLPARLSALVLVGAIGRHAWTFAGGGTFRQTSRWPLRLEIAHGPIARAGPANHPVCGYYAATFETLFRALVNPTTSVAEIACEAMGDRSCVFELRW